MPSIPKIHIEGQLHDGLNTDLIELIIEERLSQPARFLARLLNVTQNPRGETGYKYFGLHEFDFGTAAAVWIGVPPDTLYRLFNGRLNRIEAVYPKDKRPEILIQGEDRLLEYQMKIRTRVFEDVSDADIVQQIAQDYGMTAQVELDGPTHDRVVQLNQSDYDFLADRLRIAGAVMRCDQDKLTVTTGDLFPTDPVEMTVGENLNDFRVNADLRGQCTYMGVTGWDIRAKETLRQSASEDDLPSLAGPLEGGGRRLEEAFGQFFANRVQSAPATAEMAEHLAQSYYREGARQFVTGSASTEQSWLLRAGTRIQVQNAGELFNGLYRVTSLRHRYDIQNGLRTEFEVDRAWLGETGTKTKKKKGKTDGRKHPGKSKKRG